MAAQMRALTFLAVLVAAMAVVFAEETASFARLAPEGGPNVGAQQRSPRIVALSAHPIEKPIGHTASCGRG